MSSPFAAVIALQLKELNNDDLSAANNAVTGFGRVAQGNRAYSKLLELGLIRESGSPVDVEALGQALNFEIQQRLEAGTFV